MYVIGDRNHGNSLGPASKVKEEITKVWTEWWRFEFLCNNNNNNVTKGERVKIKSIGPRREP